MRTSLKPLKKPKAKRKTKTPIKVAKEKLWRLCREIKAILDPHFCYTCGEPLIYGSKSMQLGHFIPKSVCSAELAYDLRNLKWQCMFCNMYKNGEWPIFEANLIRDHGKKYVEDLKQRNIHTRGSKYDIVWYNSMITEYQKVLTELNETRP